MSAVLELRRAIPFLAFPILAFVLAVLVAACGAAIPNPLASPTPPDALHPNQPAVVVPQPTAVPNPTKLDEVARQRDLDAGVDPDLAARDDEIRVAVAQLVPGR